MSESLNANLARLCEQLAYERGYMSAHKRDAAELAMMDAVYSAASALLWFRIKREADKLADMARSAGIAED